MKLMVFVGVIVSVLASSAVDRVFEPLSGQSKDYKIGVSFLSFVAMLKNNKLPFVVTLFVSTCNKTKYITQTEN